MLGAGPVELVLGSGTWGWGDSGHKQVDLDSWAGTQPGLYPLCMFPPVWIPRDRNHKPQVLSIPQIREGDRQDHHCWAGASGRGARQQEHLMQVAVSVPSYWLTHSLLHSNGSAVLGTEPGPLSSLGVGRGQGERKAGAGVASSSESWPAFLDVGVLAAVGPVLL